VSSRALKRGFNLYDEYLEDLKAGLIETQRLAVDEEGDVLVWTSGGGASSASASSSPQSVQETAVQEDRSAPVTALIAPRPVLSAAS
jgi:hypothetical protein